MNTYRKETYTLRMTMTLILDDMKVSNGFDITFDEDSHAIRVAEDFSKKSFENLKNNLNKCIIARSN